MIWVLNKATSTVATSNYRDNAIYFLKWLAIQPGPASTETVTPPLQQSQRPWWRPIRRSEAVDAAAHRPTIAASGDSNKPLPASQDSNSTMPNIEVVSFGELLPSENGKPQVLYLDYLLQ